MEVLRFLGLPAFVRKFISALLTVIILLLPKSMFTTEVAENQYMLAGDSVFSDVQGDGWTVGFSQSVLTPADITADTYYIAGYNTNNPAKGVLDDMYAKAVYLDDNTGRGGVVLCAIDCVGISRSDINDIRQIVIESGEIPSLKSINICATHTHSAIDTQGLWGKAFYSDGKNDDFMNALKEKTADAIISAYKARENGNLYFGTAQTDGLLTDTRTPVDYDSTLTSIRFAPANGGKNTYIVNFACHAEMLGSKTNVVSADFPAYMAKEIDAQTGGANVVFVNGAIGGLVTGAEIDTFLKGELSECIEHTKQFGKNVADAVIGITNETQLQPIINVKSASVSVHCENTALLLARFIGVLNNDMALNDNHKVSIITEVSYMELGSHQIGIFMIPGELSPELASGNFLSAEESANGVDAQYKVLSEMSRCDRTFVLGLCNDELGYIIPENDFMLHEWLPYFNIPYDSFDRKHYEETNSVGPATAGTLLEAIDKLIVSASAD
ncbi:MAG: hypothetical protein IKM24_01900 [Clostridia bacterium]|nr:hypothetical protein [Clostridia bacterium]